MADEVLAEVKVLADAYNSILHGIDAHGLIVAAGTTPDYGGNDIDEDFYVYVGNIRKPINIYCPIYSHDDTHNFAEPLKPVVMINYDTHTASRQTFGRETFAGTITWTICVGENDGYLIIDDVIYNNERACMVLRNKMVRIIERLAFNNVALLQRGDTEPTNIYQTEGDDSTYKADVSLSIEYWPEIV